MVDPPPEGHPVTVIVVTWNSADTIGDCLAGLRAPGSNQSVVVVDNGSADATVSVARAACPEALVIPTGRNLGFAAACNLGSRQAPPSTFVLFLNPDTVADWQVIGSACARLTAAPDSTAALGIRLVDESGQMICPAARKFTLRSYLGRTTGLSRVVPGLLPPHFYSSKELSDAREVDQVSGAFLLVRRDVLDELGGFDERFFVYYEDADLAARLKEGGWSSLYTPNIECVHLGGTSSGKAPSLSLSLNMTSRLLYARKHWSATAVLVLALSTFTLELAGRLVLAMRQGSGAVSRLKAAYALHSRWLWKSFARADGPPFARVAAEATKRARGVEK